jgi:hypothetical protein
LPLSLRRRTRSRIFDALEARDLDLVRQLMQSDRHLRATDEWGLTPLMNAIRDGHTHLALELVALGSDVNHVGMAGGRPLGVAAMVGDVSRREFHDALAISRELGLACSGPLGG